MADVAGRWPPIYDTDALAAVIDDMAGRGLEYGRFYDPYNEDPACFQGDVVLMADGVPVFDEQGDPKVVDDFETWLVIGNSCDFDRELDDVAWSQIVPIEDLGPMSEIEARQLDALRRYTQSRRFYLPPWSDEGVCGVADFLRPVGIHKMALQRLERVARLSYHGWILLHSCLVRFLARSDGRND